MKNLKTISVILGVFLFFGCNNDKKIEEIANKYVVENIVPFFPNAQLTYMCSVRPADGVVMKIKDVEQKHKIITSNEEYLLDKKETESDFIKSYHNERIEALERELRVVMAGGKANTIEKDEQKEKEFESFFKMALLENSVIQNSIEALENANSEEGFYIVYTAIKYGEDKCQSFDIIISKDLKVLNTPIDTASINNTRWRN